MKNIGETGFFCNSLRVSLLNSFQRYFDLSWQLIVFAVGANWKKPTQIIDFFPSFEPLVCIVISAI
jgi:hypothetical protein